MKRYTLFALIIAFGFSELSFSQSKFVIQNNKTQDKIKFQFINNLIIIPIEVNGVKLNFILDSGVNKTIVFNLVGNVDVLNTSRQEKIFLNGLGDGNLVEAVKSHNNILKIGNAVKFNQTLFAVYDNRLDYSPKLGIPIYGIIGYDLFKNFVVEINYKSKYIKLMNHDSYNKKTCRKCEEVDLNFYNNKPYLSASVKIEDKDIPIHVLIDTGVSDALWIFEDKSKDLVSTDNYFDDFLGYGLNGSLYGKRSQVKSFTINSFVLNESLVAYPEGESIELLRKIKNRNGTIGGEILKRFNLVFNYHEAKLILKKNSNFNKRFNYNKSGIDIEHHGFRVVKEHYYKLNYGRLVFDFDESTFTTTKVIVNNYKLNVKPAFQIVKLRDNSPAKHVGLLVGDILLEVNRKDVKDYTLQEVIALFSGKDGKQVRILVDRSGKQLEYRFILKNLIN